MPFFRVVTFSRYSSKKRIVVAVLFFVLNSYLNTFNTMTGLFPKMINQYIVKNAVNKDNESIAHCIKNLTFNFRIFFIKFVSSF